MMKASAWQPTKDFRDRRLTSAIDNRNRFQQTVGVHRIVGTFLIAAVLALTSSRHLQNGSLRPTLSTSALRCGVSLGCPPLS